MGALGAVLQVAAGFYSAYSQGKQAESVNKAEQFNENVERKNATLAEEQTRIDRTRQRREFLQQRGAGLAAISAGGSRADSGSNQAWESDFNAQGQQENNLIARAGAQNAWNHQAQAAMHHAQGRNAIIAARRNAYATMLSSSAQAVSTYSSSGSKWSFGSNSDKPYAGSAVTNNKPMTYNYRSPSSGSSFWG